ncbi:MAG: hypothetical protein AAFP77_29420 [Bacteroidota bacterium]
MTIAGAKAYQFFLVMMLAVWLAIILAEVTITRMIPESTTTA